jgi:hypothetical protein
MFDDVLHMMGVVTGESVLWLLMGFVSGRVGMDM